MNFPSSLADPFLVIFKKRGAIPQPEAAANTSRLLSGTGKRLIESKWGTIPSTWSTAQN